MDNIIYKLHPQPDQHTYHRDGLLDTALGQRIEAERYALDQIKVEPLKLILNKTPSPNHLVIHTQYWKALQSYQTVVAVTNRIRYDIQTPEIDLDVRFWDFSRTTKRYVLDFLGTTEDELRSDIKQGNVNLFRLNRASHRVERQDGTIIEYSEEMKHMRRGGFKYARA